MYNVQCLPQLGSQQSTLGQFVSIYLCIAHFFIIFHHTSTILHKIWWCKLLSCVDPWFNTLDQQRFVINTVNGSFIHFHPFSTMLFLLLPFHTLKFILFKCGSTTEHIRISILPFHHHKMAYKIFSSLHSFFC